MSFLRFGSLVCGVSKRSLQMWRVTEKALQEHYSKTESGKWCSEANSKSPLKMWVKQIWQRHGWKSSRSKPFWLLVSAPLNIAYECLRYSSHIEINPDHKDHWWYIGDIPILPPFLVPWINYSLEFNHVWTRNSWIIPLIKPPYVSWYFSRFIPC